MKYRILFAVIALFTVDLSLNDNLSWGTEAERQAKDLAGRIVPSYASRIDFRQTDDTTDVFTIYSRGSKLVIEGNNAISMATGLNHYLKNYCGVTVSWYAFEPVQYPAEMPVVETPVRVL
jgi:alpha-N-acetylglucosaminidase